MGMNDYSFCYTSGWGKEKLSESIWGVARFLVSWAITLVLRPVSVFCIQAWGAIKISLRQIREQESAVREGDFDVSPSGGPPSGNESLTSGGNSHLSQLLSDPYRLLGSSRCPWRAESEMVLGDFDIVCRVVDGLQASVYMEKIGLRSQRQSAYGRRVTTHTCFSSDCADRGFGADIDGLGMAECIFYMENRLKANRPSGTAPDTACIASSRYS